MSAIAAELLLPGFDDPVHDAQRVFRRVLDALARPARIVRIDDAFAGLRELNARTPRALAAVLLALADADAPVWIDAVDAHELAALLRFHAGASILAQPPGAAFAAVLDAAHALPLARFDRGTADDPDRGSTVLIALDALEGGTPVSLCGPGIRHRATIAPQGLPPGFWDDRAAANNEFPRGIDIVLCDGARVIGLPRTTRIAPLED